MAEYEYQLTLPSNASGDMFPGNRPDHYITKFQTELNLVGEWEVALMDIQYPYNWANVKTMVFAVVCSYKPSGDTASLIQKACDQSYAEAYSIWDTETKRLGDLLKAIDYKWLKSAVFSKFIVIPEGFYPSAEYIGQLVVEKFKRFMPNELNSIELISHYDPVTKELAFGSKGLSTFHFATMDSTLGVVIGQPADVQIKDVVFYEPPKGLTRKCHLQTHPSMYIYTDLIKWQNVGDKMAPLLGVLPVQGFPGEQVYWSFNPPFYIPIQHDSPVATAEIRICTENGDPFPFSPAGTVVCRLHMRRKRGYW